MAKDIAASVRQKLLNKSREEKRPFQELLQYYAMERFLYRLSQTSNEPEAILAQVAEIIATEVAKDAPGEIWNPPGPWSRQADG
ncbi:hypothetical protein [Marinobacter salexigens]|uniref:hypothetical protein n=1 Tax=Marinobacter salexigens TaxID=1925763 RepID=UPI00196023E4|nr:hypothetical protein [Marinobacter salexigens]